VALGSPVASKAQDSQKAEPAVPPACTPDHLHQQLAAMFYTAALCGSFNDQRLLGKAEQSALEPAQPLPLSQALVTA